MTEFQITKHLRVKAESYETRYSWGHKAWLYLNEQEIAYSKITYYNRTWESWTFESVITSLYNKAKKQNLLSKHHLRLFKKMLDNQGKVEQKRVNDQFKSVAMIASLGAIFGKDQKESNDWKQRMLEAGIPGLSIPSDWDELSEDEKQIRLDQVIKVAQEGTNNVK